MAKKITIPSRISAYLLAYWRFYYIPHVIFYILKVIFIFISFFRRGSPTRRHIAKSVRQRTSVDS
ncbi:hypothetical protein BCR42DRAFT_412688 [Absidia repens]|uniref:Uncharacterized protein n=1 Tax=Absidia repens TaxID=90262 RepID=A0A1X2IJZ8_9FUNG|nr:hypothetical protein BCR42DRAFT_412688 [Absidia repens]